MTPQQFAHAIALTESDENQQAWGDSGRAMGRYQVHPDWVWTWAHAFKIRPALNETWDSYEGRLVERFGATFMEIMSPVRVAMYFHLGHRAVETDSDWDANYATRFYQMASIACAQPSTTGES